MSKSVLSQIHPIPPLYAENSHTLILGSFPSVLSRKTGFFYGHPQNRFWKVIAELYGCKTPVTKQEKASLIFSGIKTYSERDKKRIQREWIRYLSSEPTEFKALHFNSHVSQPLFNATCCQEALEELRFKWGSYTDLSALANLKRLRYLYIGSGAGITDITPLARLERLVVLHVEGFKKVEDYSLMHNHLHHFLRSH